MGYIVNNAKQSRLEARWDEVAIIGYVCVCVCTCMRSVKAAGIESILWLSFITRTGTVPAGKRYVQPRGNYP